jgi:hypothetical protein
MDRQRRTPEPPRPTTTPTTRAAYTRSTGIPAAGTYRPCSPVSSPAPRPATSSTDSGSGRPLDRFWPRTYKGKNPHTGHVHGSIFHVLSAEKWAGHWSPITGWLDSVNLSQGATGQQVVVVQAYLLAYWYALRADGLFGPETERLVRAFQKRSGIRVDGIVGPQTRRAFETGWL